MSWSVAVDDEIRSVTVVNNLAAEQVAGCTVATYDGSSVLPMTLAPGSSQTETVDAATVLVSCQPGS